MRCNSVKGGLIDASSYNLNRYKRPTRLGVASSSPAWEKKAKGFQSGTTGRRKTHASVVGKQGTPLGQMGLTKIEVPHQPAPRLSSRSAILPASPSEGQGFKSTVVRISLVQQIPKQRHQDQCEPICGLESWVAWRYNIYLRISWHWPFWSRRQSRVRAQAPPFKAIGV